MKKYLFIVLLLGVWSCEDTKKDENDTLNPIINFKNLNSELNQNNLSGTELIEIGIKDDGKLKHLTLKIDNELFLIDSSFKGLDTANLSYELNTKTLTNGEHTIEATLTDFFDNTIISNLDFLVDNKSKWVTYLPEEMRSIYLIENTDRYILLVSTKINEYDAKLETYSLNENGELGNLIDAHPDILPAENTHSQIGYKVVDTDNGLYHFHFGNWYKINDDGYFDLSYEFDVNFHENNENYVYFKNSLVVNESRNGNSRFTFYDFDEASKTTMELPDSIYRNDYWTNANIYWSDVWIIGVLPDSSIICTNEEVLSSNNFRLIYIDLNNHNNSFINTINGIHPSENFSNEISYLRENVWIRSEISEDGHFIIIAHDVAALFKYDNINHNFEHVSTLNTDNRFEQYLFKDNEIILFGGDNSHLFRYSSFGTLIGEYNMRDSMGYYGGVEGYFTNVMLSSDSGILFSNISYHSLNLIYKIDSDFSFPKE